MIVAIYILAVVLGFLAGRYSRPMGLTKVANKGRKPAADSVYWALRDGKTKYMFTAEQLNIAKERALKNPEDF